MGIRIRKRHLFTFLLLPFSFFLFLFSWPLPRPLFEAPLSTVVFDRDGGLLGARIAGDGQWRFAPGDSLPEKYKACLLSFEDRHFYQHPGVNPGALLRALWQNIQAGEVVSGGSTITMQTVRMARGNQSRTIWQKAIEMVWAVRLEIRRSKAEILQLYAAYAPFGGNVVGLEAASWRYFGRSPQNLSWGESAILAVLPNAPGLIYPGRNRNALKQKRDRLLQRMVELNQLDSLSCSMAILESMPQKPYALPTRAPHYVDYQEKLGGGRIKSAIQPWYQDAANRIIAKHHRQQSANQVHNLAALIIDNQTQKILAYVGNTQPTDSMNHGQQVDIIHRPRSSGSILKPILFAKMLEAGEILPGTLIPDIPTLYQGFRPENFTREYDGAVHADEALIRSLNVPSVRLLHQHGILRFYDELEELGITTLHRQAEDYGLSLILGGAEVSLWDISWLYSGWSQQVNPAVYLTLDAMKKVGRPEGEAGWQQFLSSRPIAWKTGTSFGYRDAWAIGVTPDFTIGVWVGNADGEGRPGLVGSQSAAPVLFDLFNLLPDGVWFEAPEHDMELLAVCRKSGMKAGPHCEDIDTLWIPKAGLQTPLCPYHIPVKLDQSGQYRVNSACYDLFSMTEKNWFLLPPVIANYYKAKDPRYKELPPWKPGCQPEETERVLDLLYPHAGEELYLPLNEQGEQERIVFEAVHQRARAKIFWFLDQNYVGSTSHIHKMALQPEAGPHQITLTDQDGNQLIRKFTIR